MTGIVFASDLLQEEDFVLQTDLDGLNVVQQEAYALNTIAGTYYWLLVRRTVNSQVEVGYYAWWDGEAGSETASLATETRVSFTPSDQRAAPSFDHVSITQTAYDALSTKVANRIYLITG